MNKKNNSEHPNLSWSEEEMPQKLRTKHVHGLHPYLGKYVPQLVEYFLKKYFKKGETVLDPFVGSGTTNIEANTMGIKSIGVDISAFNILMCKVKTDKYDFDLLTKEVSDITAKLNRYAKPLKAKDKSKSMTEFLPKKSKKKSEFKKAKFNNVTEYLKEWYTEESLRELLFFRQLIPDYIHQDVMKIILTRSARSARLAPHFELDWPKKPVREPYYCRKHARTCYPTSGALKFIERYGENTIKRLKEFNKLRTKADISFIHGDSRIIDFGKKVTGIMTSPPYVGIIDYHLQHQYAYELLQLEDLRQEEIGPKAKGGSKTAQKNYLKGIQEVLVNCVKQMEGNGPIIFVVNDKNNLYEDICQNIGLTIEDRITREVNRRSGRRTGSYYEDIIIMRSEK